MQTCDPHDSSLGLMLRYTFDEEGACRRQSPIRLFLFCVYFEAAGRSRGVRNLL